MNSGTRPLSSADMPKLSQRIKNDIWFGYFCLLACWVVSSYSQLEVMLREGVLFALSTGGGPCVSDFVVVYSGAVLARQSAETGVSIYDSVAQTNIVKELVAPVVPQLPFSLQYPPYVFALIKPLAQVNITHAWFIWTALSLSCLALSVYFLTASRFKSKVGRLFVLLAVLASYPCWLGIRIGQTCFLLLLGLSIFWIFLRAGKFFYAGCATALCLIKVQYAPILIVVGIVQGRLKYLWGLVLAATGLFLISVVGVGWNNTVAYLNWLANGEMNRVIAGVDALVMQNIRGELTLITASDTSAIRWLSVAFLGAATLAAAFLWSRVPAKTGDDGRTTFDVYAAFTVFAMLIASPHTHSQDYVIAVLPCVWLWSITSGLSRWLILLFPVLSWVFFLTMPLWLALKIEPFLLWAVLVLATRRPARFADSAGTSA